MSNFKNGTYKLLYIYLVDAYYPVGCLTSNSFSEASDMLDTTTRQNAGGWKTSIPTNQSYSISFSGLVTTSNKGGSILTYNDLQNLKRNRTLINWKSNTEIDGYSDFGNGYISSLSQDANVDENISFSAEIIGYGAPINSNTDLLLLESGNYILTEINGKIIL